jgi:hypothetical protein
LNLDGHSDNIMGHTFGVPVDPNDHMFTQGVCDRNLPRSSSLYYGLWLVCRSSEHVWSIGFHCDDTRIDDRFMGSKHTLPCMNLSTGT